MRATITSKGQITIPIGIRKNLRLKTGDVLEFDETAPYLKATKAISPRAWTLFEEAWQDPWPDRSTEEVLDEIRGPVELPVEENKE